MITELNEWQCLSAHFGDIKDQHMREWFTNESNRFPKYSLSVGELFLDFSRNRINQRTLTLFASLANALQLSEKIAALFKGEPINISENRPALHTALRDKEHTPLFIQGKNIAYLIQETNDRMQQFVMKIHNKKWLGITGKPIKSIVNIGIGGSYMGPKMTIRALKDFAKSDLSFHFIASVDPLHLQDVLAEIDLETTLFIISSKSFTTIETLTNANTIISLMKNKWGAKVMDHHFVAITAQMGKAIELGLPKEQIFPLWDFVGGRYSIWSAIGLPLMLLIGHEHFSDFLLGGYEMDLHFQQADYEQNMPVLMALIGIWYLNFFGAKSHAIIPYSYRLRDFIPYLQQAEMESNGKSVNMEGSPVPYATGPVLFGEEGLIGQHAYHQLLHQGKHFIPADFILVGSSIPSTEETNPQLELHQEVVIASALSQADALMRGKTHEEALREASNGKKLNEKTIASHKIIPGNKPSNIIFLKSLTPKNLGALIALYEHKIFVQGVLWRINSFDQWGVELGKQLLPDILQELKKSKKTLEKTNEVSTPINQATFDLINYLSENMKN